MKISNKNTIISKTKPKSKAVTWIDTSGNQPIMKKFINGLWRPIGGGEKNSGSSEGFSWPIQSLVRRTPTEEDLAKFIDPDVDYNTVIVLPSKGVVPAVFTLTQDSYEQVYLLSSAQNGEYDDEDPTYDIDGTVTYFYIAGEDHFVSIEFSVDREATVLLGRMSD